MTATPTWRRCNRRSAAPHRLTRNRNSAASTVPVKTPPGRRIGLRRARVGRTGGATSALTAESAEASSPSASVSMRTMSADADTASSSNPLAAAASMTGCGGNGGAALRRRSTNSPSALASAWAVACSDRCASRSRWRRSSSSERRRSPSDVSAAFAARSRANSSASPSISTRVRAAASWAATRRRSSRRKAATSSTIFSGNEIGNRLLPSFGTDQPQARRPRPSAPSWQPTPAVCESPRRRRSPHEPARAQPAAACGIEGSVSARSGKAVVAAAWRPQPRFRRRIREPIAAPHLARQQIRCSPGPLYRQR